MISLNQASLLALALFSSWTSSGKLYADDAVPATQPTVIRLWQGDAPAAKGSKDEDIPSLTLFHAARATSPGSAIIVCPGGGYGGLAITYEGYDVAKWLNTFGVDGYVLKYRLGSHGYHHPVELGDLQRAIRTARANAADWHIDPHHVGVLGFSAGGHLASTAVTHFDAGNPDASDVIERMSSRPDLGILIYPVITLTGPFAHTGSRENLLGPNADPALIEDLSNQKKISPNTPPCFLVHGVDDKVVPVENSIEFVLSCRKNNVQCEVHLFEHGAHGFGLGKNDPALKSWPADAVRWLEKHQFTSSG